MAITYPYDPPSSPKPRSVAYRALSLTGMSEAPLSLAQQVQAHQGEALALEVELPPMTRAEAEDWIAWRLALRGRFGYFRWTVDPTAASPRGAVSGSPVANSALSPAVNLARERQLYVRSLAATTAGVFKAGDWISVPVSSLPRLHKNLTDKASDSSGLATLEIWPALRADALIGEADDRARAAWACIIAGVRALEMIGGGEATASTLQGLAVKVRAGRFGCPQHHEPGHA